MDLTASPRLQAVASACLCTTPVLFIGPAPLDAVPGYEDAGWFSVIRRIIRLCPFASRTGRLLTDRPADPAAMMLPAAISTPLNLLSTMGWAVAGLYPVALFTVLYRDVRDVSEGLDLQAAIAARLGRHPG